MSDDLLVTVIVPVWRDADALAHALGHLPPRAGAGITVAAVLGEECHYTATRAIRPDVEWVFAPRGRAVQMNAGAAAARGRWLLFLHADSRLPADWMEVVARADATPDAVAGAFTLTLDSRDWRARLIELGVRFRVALLGMPYGDQALFVRREVFAALGGYRDLPLMEDIDFVRRLRPAGRLLQSRSRVVTSARRWERDGWLRRSAENATLATRFLLGASPARLAQRYCRRHARAIVLMARAPWTGGKTRLHRSLDEEAHARLRHALFLDTLDVVTSVADAEHVVACEPEDASEQMRNVAGPAVDVLPQRGTDLGNRLVHAFEDAFRLGAECVVVIGSDLPDLPAHLLEKAFDVLNADRRTVVLGPAADGGYYLVGMTRPHPGLFEAIDWSTGRVLEQTLDAAEAQDIPVALLDQWRDVDDDTDLERLRRDSSSPGAPRVRAWLAERC